MRKKMIAKIERIGSINALFLFGKNKNAPSLQNPQRMEQ